LSDVWHTLTTLKIGIAVGRTNSHGIFGFKKLSGREIRSIILGNFEGGTNMAGACAAVNTLQLALKSSIPFLGGTYKEWNGSTQSRLQISGNPRHQMGVCLDIILFCEAGLSGDKTVDWKTEKVLGENIVKAFVDLKADMKWTEIIFQDRLFWEPEYYKHYGADRKHFTHIHIDWMTNGLKGHDKTEAEVLSGSPQKDTTGFSGALTTRLSLINLQYTGGTLAGLNVATIPKTASADSNPVGNWNVTVDRWLWNYPLNADGSVTWRDPFNGQNGAGKWEVGPGKISFTWFNSKTTESWDVPRKPLKGGETTMEGKAYDVNAVRA